MKKIAIIGAGVAGLSAGCYALMNGYRVDIFESHNLPGGVCTSWRRGDYLFDHCLHWVLGSGRGNSLYPLFEELGVAPGVEFYYPERFRKIRAGGKDLIVYTDIDRFEEELLALFPQEEKSIRRLAGQVRFFTGFRPPADADFGSFSPGQLARMLPYLPSLYQLMRTTIEGYLSMFDDALLREMLFQMFPVRNLPALIMIMALAYFHNHEGGYPLGGSLNFARAIEKRFLGLGGKLHYGRKVTKIEVEHGKAAGIVTAEGECVGADTVISACDGRTALFDLLEGRYLTPRLASMYEQPQLWEPIISVSFGVNRAFPGEVEINNVKLDQPLDIAGRPVEWLGYFLYDHDPAFAPPGKGVVELQIETDYDYWKNLCEDRERYRDEKEKVAALCLKELERIYSGISGQVEAADVATPVTWERYTANWRGSYQGWMPTAELFVKKLPRQLPGLGSFYMTGQWVLPGGGVPMCMAGARRLVKQICKDDGFKFKVMGGLIPKAGG